jgi:hypothetical protein
MAENDKPRPEDKGPVFVINRPAPSQLQAAHETVLIEGADVSAWYRDQGDALRRSFMREIRTSLANGENLAQAATRITGGTVDGVTVPGIMNTTKRRASALASTAIQEVQKNAALATYQANSDVIKWVTQVSTLDNRTSDICIAYSGQTWDVETLQPVPPSTLPFNTGPPRHWNCRSTLRPVTRSFRELGVDRDEIPAGTRASMDGQIPADISFKDWLAKKPVAFQDKLLGKKRAQLWRDGKITLTQLVDFRGNPLTIEQLEARIRGK